jgi:hypothetical protein
MLWMEVQGRMRPGDAVARIVRAQPDGSRAGPGAMVDLTDSVMSFGDEDPDEGPEDTRRETAAPPPAAGDELAAAVERWTDAVRSVQKSIDEAAAAIRSFREMLAPMAPLLRSLGVLEEALSGFAVEAPQAQPAPKTAADIAPAPAARPPLEAVDKDTTPLPATALEEETPERAWQSWRRRPGGRERPAHWTGQEEDAGAVAIGPPRAALKPVTLVPDDTIAPYSYRVTVEDPRKPLELVPLHQALSTMPAVRNMSLLSYVNGVASIALESTEEILPPDIENAIHKTMKRSCSVLPHDSNTILVQVGE